jgi:hypothetical protein
MQPKAFPYQTSINEPVEKKIQCYICGTGKETPMQSTKSFKTVTRK